MENNSRTIKPAAAAAAAADDRRGVPAAAASLCSSWNLQKQPLEFYENLKAF
jgi:hypothetical protein